MDTNNNNNPLDPGLGSTPSTNDASSDAPVVAPDDMGVPVSPAPVAEPVEAPVMDTPVAPVSDAPAPDMGVPAPAAEVPAPAPVADTPSAVPANDAPVGFDPAIPAAEAPVGDAQYNADLDAAKADFHAGMDEIEKKYDAPAPDMGVPAPAAEVPAPAPVADTPNEG